MAWLRALFFHKIIMDMPQVIYRKSPSWFVWTSIYIAIAYWCTPASGYYHQVLWGLVGATVLLIIVRWSFAIRRVPEEGRFIVRLKSPKVAGQLSFDESGLSFKDDGRNLVSVSIHIPRERLKSTQYKHADNRTISLVFPGQDAATFIFPSEQAGRRFTDRLVSV